MTRDEERTLFKGTMPATRAALALDDNFVKFEAIWEARDTDEMLARLKEFHLALGTSTLRLCQGTGPKLRNRIAADVGLVSRRIGWSWIATHAEPQGTA